MPGATLTAANTLTGKKYFVVTNAEGKFLLTGMARGRYVIRIEFMGFALFTQEIALNPDNQAGKIDAELILASRQQQPSNDSNRGLAAGRGFQSLALDSTLSSLAGGNSPGVGAGIGNNDLASLPLSGAGLFGLKAGGPMFTLYLVLVNLPFGIVTAWAAKAIIGKHP